LAPSPSARAATQQHTATVDHSRPSFSSPSPRGHRAASMPALQPSMLAECGIVLAELGIGAEADYEPEALEPSMRETARQASRAEREQAAEQTLKARRRRPSFLPRELERLDIAWRLGTASTGHVRGSVAVSAQSSPSLTRRSMAMRRRSTVRQGLHTDEDSTTQEGEQLRDVLMQKGAVGGRQSSLPRHSSLPSQSSLLHERSDSGDGLPLPRGRVGSVDAGDSSCQAASRRKSNDSAASTQQQKNIERGKKMGSSARAAARREVDRQLVREVTQLYAVFLQRWIYRNSPTSTGTFENVLRFSYPDMSVGRRTELTRRALACYALRQQADDRAEVEKRWREIDTAGQGYIELHQLLVCDSAQVRRYDYEMFATESGRSVFASADLDADGRIDLAGFSKIVHAYKLLNSYSIEGGGGVDRVENAQQQAEKARETLQQQGPNHARRLQQTLRR